MKKRTFDPVASYPPLLCLFPALPFNVVLALKPLLVSSFQLTFRQSSDESEAGPMTMERAFDNVLSHFLLVLLFSASPFTTDDDCASDIKVPFLMSIYEPSKPSALVGTLMHRTTNADNCPL